MREARVILPRPSDVEGMKAFDAFQEWLVDYVGGYTSYEGRGGWKDPSGEHIVEAVVIFDTAFDPEVCQSLPIREAAIKAGRAMRQQAVYFRDMDGTVSIIDVPPLPGQKRLPETGDIWITRGGDEVVVSFIDGREESLRRLVGAVLVSGTLPAGRLLRYSEDGRYLPDGSNSVLDLVKFSRKADLVAA